MLKRIQAIAKVEFVENYGYDFGMYNAYFTTHPTDIRTYDQILLCNDSVIIHKPLIDVFQTIDTMNAEYM
jgi:lipopolysaccharide biosynthesis protein